jgi:hypothetical protein
MEKSCPCNKPSIRSISWIAKETSLPGGQDDIARWSSRIAFSYCFNWPRIWRGVERSGWRGEIPFRSNIAGDRLDIFQWQQGDCRGKGEGRGGERMKRKKETSQYISAASWCCPSAQRMSDNSNTA